MTKKIFSVMLSLLIGMSSISALAYSDYSDEAVMALTELGILSGYDDGSFQPDVLITRAEFSKIISVVNGGKNSNDFVSNESVFSDVDNNHWALNYILHCNNLNLINGYENGTFKPNENISFAEMVKVCLSSIGYDLLIQETGDSWYAAWINLAYEYKIIDTKDKDSYDKVTRAEVADMVYKTINLPLCIVTGYEGTEVKFDFADGTTDENGIEKPFRSLFTTYFQ